MENFIFSIYEFFIYYSRHTPHAPTGQDAKKGIKREIERRLDCVSRIYFEPRVKIRRTDYFHCYLHTLISN